MTARTLFITGTDTGVGKTRMTVAMLRGLQRTGHRAAGYKPVASGCETGPQGLRNADALALQQAGSAGWRYDAINPYAFEPAIAPHIAAAEAGVTVQRRVLDAGHDQLAAASDYVIVEGAGGWHVPLADDFDFADWVSERQWPVVLIVGMRLGCVNHALLSARAIAARAPLVGWIANTLPPCQPRLEDNIDCLRQRLEAPLLARVRLHPRAEYSLNPTTWL